jgi:hypothetical protein
MRRLICMARTVWGTVTMPVFWRSLVIPPLVVYSGHVWPYPPVWGHPKLSPDPDDWPGLVEFDESRCVDCGYREYPRPWRRYNA